MAAFTHIQGSSASDVSGTLTSIDVVLPANPTTGNVVCIAAIFSSHVTGVAAQDANGNNYTVTPSSPNNIGTGGIWLLYLLNAPSNADKTITISWTTAAEVFAWCDEFSSDGLTTSFDQDAVGSGGPATTINTPSITPTVEHELLYGFGGTGGGTITAPTAGSTLGVWTGAEGGIQAGVLATEYVLDSANTSTALDFTTGSSTAWVSMMMAIRIAATSSLISQLMMMGMG